MHVDAIAARYIRFSGSAFLRRRAARAGSEAHFVYAPQLIEPPSSAKTLLLPWQPQSDYGAGTRLQTSFNPPTVVAAAAADADAAAAAAAAGAVSVHCMRETQMVYFGFRRTAYR
jgi:hypothetical protein